MKSLLIVRHAKSSWEDITDDFNRPLNERGKHDAPEMAKKLLNNKIAIEAFVSSPAKRARKTAKLFMEEFEHSKDDLILKPELYNAHFSVFYDVVAAMDNKFDSIALFAHNPGITDFVNSLTTTQIDDMPTCGVFAIKIHADGWLDLAAAEKEFWFFNYPKLKN